MGSAPKDGTPILAVGRFHDATAGFPQVVHWYGEAWRHVGRGMGERLVCWAWMPRPSSWPREGEVGPMEGWERQVQAAISPSPVAEAADEIAGAAPFDVRAFLGRWSRKMPCGPWAGMVSGLSEHIGEREVLAFRAALTISPTVEVGGQSSAVESPSGGGDDDDREDAERELDGDNWFHDSDMESR